MMIGLGDMSLRNFWQQEICSVRVPRLGPQYGTTHFLGFYFDNASKREFAIVCL